MTPEERARDLVAGGYRQISSKYRTVARMPPGMTGLEALANVNPRLAQGYLDNANELAAQQYLRCYPGVDKIILTYEEFGAFKRVAEPKWVEPPRKSKELPANYHHNTCASKDSGLCLPGLETHDLSQCKKCR